MLYGLPEQGENRGRLGIGDRQGLCRCLAEDLGPRQLGGLRGEIGVADRGLGRSRVLQRDTQTVDRRSDRVLLERTEASTEGRDLLDGLVDDLLGVREVAVDDVVGLRSQ